MVYPVVIATADDARKLSQVATKQDFSMYISYHNTLLDLRSLLGLFTLIGQNCSIIAPDHVDPFDFYKALKQMGILG